MKNSLVLVVMYFFSLQCAAQDINLIRVSPTPQFQDADVGAIALGDVDNDGDLDVIATGKGGPIRTTLYINDGTGAFSEAASDPFVDVFSSAVSFEDVDNDNFLDLLIIGNTSSPMATANLYMNDGFGNFTLAAGTPFEPSHSGDIAFSDVDNDNDMDVVISAYDAADMAFSKLYLNDGLGGFTEVIGTPFLAVKDSGVAFIDIEGDNDDDLLISGTDDSGTLSTTLYSNDGFGNFSLVAATPFVACSSSEIAIGDSDNDGDDDILLSGGAATGAISQLYTNDGNGNFSLVAATPFEGATIGTSEFADFDNDGDLDVFIGGAGNSGVISHIYENQGSNNFVLADALVAAYLASAAIGDLDGDTDLDVIIGGTSFSFPTRATKTYFNTLFTDANLLLDEQCLVLIHDPSPTTFVLEGYLDIYTIEILDASENVVQTLTPTSNSLTIDTTTLPAGLFFVRVMHNSNSALCFQAIIKE